MGDNLSSEGAEESYSGKGDVGSWKPTDYDTIEEFIMNTERDEDKEVGKSIRMFKWQEMLMTMIEVEINTKKSEIAARAYPMGVSILRNDHKGDVDEIATMLHEFMKVYTSDGKNLENADKTNDRLTDKEIEQPYEEENTLTDSKRYPIPDSYLSEADRDYADHSFMKGWIHRHIMALGLGKSENTEELHENKISSYAAAFSNAIDDLRESVEGEIMNYVQRSEMTWRRRGLSEGVYDGLMELTEHMETDNKEDLEFKLQDLERFVEVDGDE